MKFIYILYKNITDDIKYKKEALDSLNKILKSNNPEKFLSNEKSILEQLNHRINTKIYSLVEENKEKVSKLNHILMTLNPLNVLSRGYSIILDEGNDILNSVEELKKKDNITIFMKDGNINMDIKIKDKEKRNG